MRSRHSGLREDPGRPGRSFYCRRDGEHVASAFAVQTEHGRKIWAALAGERPLAKGKEPDGVSAAARAGASATRSCVGFRAFGRARSGARPHDAPRERW